MIPPAPFYGVVVVPEFGHARVRAHTAEWTQDQWLCDRKNYLGASEVGAVLGWSRYAGPWTVAMRKRGKLEPFEGNFATRRGHAMEPLILAEFERETGIELEYSPPYVLQHPEHPMLCCNLDGWAGMPVEAKSTGPHMRKYWLDVDQGVALGADHPCAAYMGQIQTQMAVTGTDHAYFAVDAGELLWIPVGRDEAMVRFIEDNAPAYWRLYVEGDATPNCTAADLGQVTRYEGEKGVELSDPHLRVLILKRDEHSRKQGVHRAAMGAEDKLRKHVDAQIAAWLRERGIESGSIELDGHERKLNIKPGRRTAKLGALKAAHPDIYEQFTSTGDPGLRISRPPKENHEH